MSYHRSRTPHGNKNSEWISRQVATFGRYQERRPAGLRVDASGAFELSNLMHCWGQSQGLTEEDVRNALIENQNHGGHQRFTLEYAENDWSKSGNVKIRVHKRNQGGWQQTSNNSASGGQARHNDWSNKSDSGSHGQNKHTDWWSSNSYSSQQQSSESSSRKLPTPNRAFNIFSNGATNSSESKGVWDDDTRKDEKEWFQHDDRSNGKEWWKEASKKEEGNKTKQWDKASGEQIQKWLGWVLKSGYREIGIFLRDREWGSLDVLAEILSSQKSHLNVSNAADLKDVLLKTDEAGRFEIVDGEVRKVPRDSRVMKSGEDNGKQKWQNSSWSDSSKKAVDKPSWGSSAGSKNGAHKASGSQSASQKDSKPDYSKPKSRSDYDPWSLIGAGSPPRNDEPATPEGSPRRDDNAVREDADQDAQEEEQSMMASAPDPPPGDHWKKFIDEGYIWHFYDGPLGKWWCQEDDPVVQPYEEETEE